MPTYRKNNAGLEIITARIWNWINDPSHHVIQLFLFGDSEPGKPQYYLKNLEGDVALFPPQPQSVSAYVQNLDLVGEPNRNWVDIQIPRLKAGRMYFSIGSAPDAIVPANGRPGIGNLPGNDDYETFFDFLEFDWSIAPDKPNTTLLGFNTTQVDSFSLPMGVEFTGLEPSRGEKIPRLSGFNTGKDWKPGVRQTIINNMKKAPDPWNKLVVNAPKSLREAGISEIRVLNPEKGMLVDAGNNKKLFPEDQLDDYITKVWNKYKGEDLVFAGTEEGVTLTGRVNAQNNLVFASADRKIEITFPKPTTNTVYTSGPNPTTDSGNARRIRANLQAGFLRSNLLVNNKLPACDASQFYKNEPINYYAKILHEAVAAGGGFGAYAFGFDDVCSVSSYVVVRDPETVNIHLLSFS